MFCSSSRHRLGAGTGDTERFGITGTGRQDDQQAKSKNRAHAEICVIPTQSVHGLALILA
jgi:hypothetical protein